MAFYKCALTGYEEVVEPQYGIEELYLTNQTSGEYIDAYFDHKPFAVLAYDTSTATCSNGTLTDVTPRMAFYRLTGSTYYCPFGKYYPSGSNNGNSQQGMAGGSESPYSFTYAFQFASSSPSYQTSGDYAGKYRVRLRLPWKNTTCNYNFHFLAFFNKNAS